MKDYRDELVLILAFSALFVLLGLCVLPVEPKMSDYGTYGDFIGGALGTVISAITIGLLFLTFKVQKDQTALTREELEYTKKELKEEKELVGIQRFETTFFNMLSMLNTISKDLNEGAGNKFFIEFAGKLVSTYYIERNSEKFLRFASIKMEEQKKGNSLSIEEKTDVLTSFDHLYLTSQFQTRNRILNELDNRFPYKTLINWIFLYQYEEHTCRTGHFFRYIYQITKLIKRQFKNDTDKIKEYATIITAQLTAHQLVILFYNCLSDVGLSYGDDGSEELKFYEFVKEYDMVRNIDKQLLIKEEHYEMFYSKKEQG